MPSKTYIKIFNLYPEGPDSDYGVINSETVKVTIEQSWEWDEESIQDMKEYLSEFYDVSVGRVATDEDLAAENEYWEKEGFATGERAVQDVAKFLDSLDDDLEEQFV